MRLPSPPTRVFRLALLPLLLATTPAWAQDDQFSRTVIQTENVRYGYAQVLRVTPVYQTLTATAIERRCDGEPVKKDSRLSRVVGAVKDALTPESDQAGDEALAEDCVAVPVERQYRRPIAYDVDYVYKGAKYRSRLPEDPGNRLRIRIGVTPVVTSPR